MAPKSPHPHSSLLSSFLYITHPSPSHLSLSPKSFLSAKMVSEAQLPPVTSPDSADPTTKVRSPDSAEPAPKVQKTTHPPVLRFKRLSDHAVAPERASATSVRFLLAAAADVVIPATGVTVVPTDLSFVLPEGTYGRIVALSELAYKDLIDVGDGVIGGDFDGPVEIVLFNHSTKEVKYEAKTKVASLILHEIETPVMEEVEELPPPPALDVPGNGDVNGEAAPVGPGDGDVNGEAPPVVPANGGVDGEATQPTSA